MTDPYQFQVFVNEQGDFGDPVGLILDEGRRLDTKKRIAIASELPCDETVFVNSLADSDVSIYHSQGEVDFAGTVLVGAAWQLSLLKGEPVTNIHCLRGDIKSWQEGPITWVRAGLQNNLGSWDYEQVGTPKEVESINVSDTQGWKKMVWAWIDEGKGLIRARTFASKINMPETQGNGSGAMNLAGQLNRNIVITHGNGSVIHARPASENHADLGGRVHSLDNAVV
jgi:predicted PhzF superfamily epimerase YddE/YHI9